MCWLAWEEAAATCLCSQWGLELFPEPRHFSIKTPEKCDNASLPTSQSILRCQLSNVQRSCGYSEMCRQISGDF